jgi:hypothetical protein
METNTPLQSPPQDTTQIDISEYEKLSAEWYQNKDDISPDTEKKIEYLLLKVIFIAKIISLVAFLAVFCFVGYSWSRNQTQNSWIMKQTTYVYQGSAICNWVNSWNTRKIDASSEFLEFLDKNPRKDLNLDFKKLLSDNTCLTPDTLSHLLGMEEKFMTEKLKEAYETTLIKKFLGSTLESSDEIDTILALDPENRLKHVEVLRLISEKVQAGTIRGKNTITCSDAKFQWLSTDMSCTIKSIPPIQPRDEAIKFLESLEKTDRLLVSYPTSLDLKVDTKDNVLSTSFNVNIVYVPARYESDALKKI